MGRTKGLSPARLGQARPSLVKPGKAQDTAGLNSIVEENPKAPFTALQVHQIDLWPWFFLSHAQKGLKANLDLALRDLDRPCAVRPWAVWL